jgi:putative ATP-dependent endonuclease of OLD family
MSDFNPIVGYNNSGKSNILRAISWLLRKSVLQGHVFHDTTVAVTVEGIIENVNLQLLPANQQQAVARYPIQSQQGAYRPDFQLSLVVVRG